MKDYSGRLIQAGDQVMMVYNGILGVKTPTCEGVYDCSPQGPGARFWEGELAVISATLTEDVTAYRTTCDHLQLAFPDGRRGYVMPDEVVRSSTRVRHNVTMPETPKAKERAGGAA